MSAGAGLSFVLRRAFVLAAFVLLGSVLNAADLAITTVTVHIGNGQVLEGATVLVSDGKIAALGKDGGVQIPAGAERIDASGLHLMPGMIDVRSLELVPESSNAFGADAKMTVADGLDSFEDWIFAREEGVTTVAVSGAGGSNQSSLGAILKLRCRKGTAGSLAELLLGRESHIVLSLGVAGSTSTSAQRLEQYYALRRQLVAARDYSEAWDKYWKEVEKYNKAAGKYNAELKAKKAKAEGGKKKDEKEPEKKEPEKKESKEPEKKEPEKKESKEPEKKEPEKKESKKPARPPAKAAPAKPPASKGPKAPKVPKLNMAFEALSRALKGELTVFVEAHRADDVRYALRLRKEFKLELTILGAGRALAASAELAASGVTVAVGPILHGSLDLRRSAESERLAGAFAKAGIPLAISSGASSGVGSRYLRLQACAAVRGGLDSSLALQAITMQPAKCLGLEKRIGSIEKGKDADLVLLDGPPLDVRSRVVSVIVEGRTDSMRRAAAEKAGQGPAAGLSFDEIKKQGNSWVPGGPTILKNAVVMRAAGGGLEVIEKATVVIRKGKIEKVTTDPVKEDASTAVYDLAGRFLLPGFIDAHSHITLKGDVDDLSKAVNDELRVLDSFDPWDDDIATFLGRGVTTVALSPGRNNVVGGAVSLVKLLHGGVPLRVLRKDAAVKTSLAPNLNLARYPTAHSGAGDAFGGWLKSRYGKDSKRFRVPVVAYFENITQAERAFALASGHGVPMIFLEGVGTDGGVFGQLPRGSRAILGPYSIEEPERVLRAPAILEEQGVPFSWATGGTLVDPLSSVALAVMYGLSEAEGLRSLTIHPAAMYGVSERIGRIEKGADADLVVWDGNPLTLTAPVNLVFIDGELVYQDGQALEAPVKLSGTAEDAGIPAVQGKIKSPAALKPASSPTILVRARKVHTVSGEPLEPGQVLIRAGKIVQLGKRIDIDKATPGLLVIDVPGTICPGLIDAGSGLGVSGRRADEFRELTPGLPALLGSDLGNSDRRVALRAGVTVAAVTPGDRNVIGGLGGVIKTHGAGLAESVLKETSFVAMSLTEMASSGNRNLRSGRPTSYLYRIPNTRMGTVFLARRALMEALPGALDAGRAVGDLKAMLTPPERIVLREVHAGGRVLRVRAQARYEILTALRIAEEFGLKIQIEGAREAIHLVDLLKEKQAALVLSAGETWSGRELEANLNLGARLPAELYRAGVPFAFYSDRASLLASLRERVTWRVRNGLSEAAALEALTLAAARILGVSDRVGSLEPGKDADLVAFGGSPFDLKAGVLWVMVNGELVADPSRGASPIERPREKINQRRSLAPRGDY